MDENLFSGSLPSEVGLLTSLTRLGLNGNVLTGSLPSELGLLTSLFELRLGRNSLTGTLPSDLGSLTRLSVLVLSGNSMTGTLPSELGLLSGIQSLYLSENLFSGFVPVELGLPPGLLEVTIERTNITGNLDSVFCNRSSPVGSLSQRIVCGTRQKLNAVAARLVTDDLSCENIILQTKILHVKWYKQARFENGTYMTFENAYRHLQ